MRDKNKLLLGISVSVLVISCSTVSPPQKKTLSAEVLSKKETKKEEKKQAIRSLKEIKHFRIKGAIAVKEKKEGFQASYYWKQSSPNNFYVRFFGPMGAKPLTINANAHGATIKSEDKTVHGSDINSLIYQQTGHHIPINKLYYWLRGLPAPGMGHQQMRNAQRLVQGNWSIDYQQYTIKKGIQVPAKLLLRAPDLKIKLRITQWQF